jgi:hypothetical protein
MEQKNEVFIWDGTSKIPKDVINVKVADDVKKIPAEAFMNCKQLKSVILPEGVTKIEKYAFFGCSNLEFIQLPNSLQRINDKAFMNCSNLKSLTIPEGVTNIDGSDPFYNCKNLKVLILPDSLRYIEQSCVMECNDLEYIIYKDKNINKSLTVSRDLKQALEDGISLNLDDKIKINDYISNSEKYDFEKVQENQKKNTFVH